MTFLAALFTVLSWASAPHQVHLKACESGGNYQEWKGEYGGGAYQFDPRTWANLTKGLPWQYAAQAPPWVQDAIAYKLWVSRGYQPWPVCGR